MLGVVDRFFLRKNDGNAIDFRIINVFISVPISNCNASKLSYICPDLGLFDLASRDVLFGFRRTQVLILVQKGFSSWLTLLGSSLKVYNCCWVSFYVILGCCAVSQFKLWQHGSARTYCIASCNIVEL